MPASTLSISSSLLLAADLSIGEFKNPLHILAYAADLLLVQAWSMRMVNFFNGGAWTLSVEAFFYVLFPFLLLRLRPRTRNAALGWIAAFYALAMLVPLIDLRLYPLAGFVEQHGAVPGSMLIFSSTRMPIFALPEFLAGVSIGWFFLRFRPSLHASAVMLNCGLVLLTTMLMLVEYLPYIALHNGLLIPAYGLILVGLSQPNWLSRLLSAPLLVLLGEASFALYLLNAAAMQLAAWNHWDSGLVLPLCNLALTIAAAILMQLYLERPARKAILSWWSRRHPNQLKTV